MTLKKLLIVSDTRINYSNGEYYAFNSVVNELSVFLEIFSSITWIGYDYSDKPIDGTLLKISHPDVKIILLPRSGGKNYKDKLRILSNLLLYLRKIIFEAKGADVVHSRGPSVPMLLALLVALLYKNPKWWFKYANNWNDSYPPFFWNIQKKLMVKIKSSVGTVNGVWENLPEHIFPFENPCLEDDLAKTKDLVLRTTWRLLFVGRLEEKKGFGLVLDAISHLPIQKIENITFIGDGEDMSVLRANAERYLGVINIIILGNLPKKQVFVEMQKADFILLPSRASEGFPKVIAEAWYNGCVPVVSSVSCVGQYVKNGVNGFLWDLSSDKFYWEALQEALSISRQEFYSISQAGSKMCKNFTYHHYSEMIRKKLLL